MNGTPAVKSRRNLSRTQDRQVWLQAHNENHPMRYRLHCQGGAYNMRCDQITLLAEMRESKPYWIERIPPRDVVLNFANLPAHQCMIGNIELLEIERIPAGRTGQEGLAAATQLQDGSLRSCSPSELRNPVWLEVS